MNAPLNLVQGTKEWMDFRAAHYGASEAASMLGLSKQLNRNDLLLFKKTGKSKEYSDWVQKNILDYGHEVEAKAREILEAEINDELFQVTYENDLLSASCDGITMDGSIAFEHKQWSGDLVDYITDNQSLPDSHMPQCQQILLVTGAKRVIFVCSDGTESNRVMIDVYPDQEWFKRIKSGWEQFTRDLETFEPKEFADKPEPAAIMQLPALSIQIKGEVTLSNLPQFKEAAESFIANIKTDLQTDEDFANAEATVKFCDETERKLEAAKQSAIGQTASIDELMRTIDHIKDQIRSKRLTLEKSVKNEKENRKKEIIDNAHTIIRNHVEELRKEFKQCDFVLLAQNLTSRQFLESACKNKRTIASLHNAVDTEVAAIKIKLDELARIIRKNLTHLPDDLSLFRDLQSIITKPEEDFKLLVESRLAEQKRKEEEAKERAIAEVKAAEERGRAQAAAVAERERLAKENEEKRIQAIKEAETNRLKQEAIAKAELEARNAEIKRKEEAARAASLEHRTKIIQEARESIESLEDVTLHGILNAIIAGEIKHVTINF